MSDLFVSYQGGVGEALVLLHGFGFTSQVWQPLIDELTQNYAVYVVDLPGFGRSKLMDWNKFKTILLNSLPRHFMVVGWSMGGGYGMQLASELSSRLSLDPKNTKSERVCNNAENHAICEGRGSSAKSIVTNLICIGASPKFIKDITWPGIEAKFFDEFCVALEKDPIETLKKFVKTQSGKDLELDLNTLPQQEAMQASLKLLKNLDLRFALKKVTKACFMFGRLDKIIPVATLKIMQKQYPTFDYVLFKHDAHMPFISNQKMFLTELKRVLGTK